MKRGEESPAVTALRQLVSGWVAGHPAITARELAGIVRATGRACSLSYAHRLLADARGGPRPPRPRGARVWLDVATLERLRAAALPGEELSATVARLAASATAW